MLNNIRKDLSAITKNGSFLQKLKCVLINHSFHLILLYRVGCSLSKPPIIGRVFRVIFEYVIKIVYASDISLTSEIGPGLVIVHGFNIVVGGAVRIGSGCKILNGVTLGNKDLDLPINMQPTLGDNVIIGSGAKLLGAIEIGNNVVIGANSVVLRSMPSNVVVAGIPAKIVKVRDSRLL